MQTPAPPSNTSQTPTPALSGHQSPNSSAPSTLCNYGSYTQGGNITTSSAPLSGPAPAPAPSGPGSSGVPPSPNVVQSTSGIHIQGMFYALEVNDYLQNDVAIRTLLNEKNALLSEKNELQRKLRESADPHVVRNTAIAASIGNLVATILVGIGINLETADQVPPHAHWVLGVGVVLAAVSVTLPIISAYGKRNV